MTCQNLMVPWEDFGQINMAKSCVVASLMTCQNLMVILAIFWSGYHCQILPGSITSDLSEPYGNLGKILVGSGQILRGSITNDLSEPYGNLGKILVRSQ